MAPPSRCPPAPPAAAPRPRFPRTLRVRRRPSNRCQRTTRPAAGVRPPTGAVPAGPRGRYRLGTARVDRYVPRTTGASHMAPARRTTPPADRGGLGGRRRAARGLPPVSPAGLPPVSHRPIFKDRSPTARARTHTAFFLNTSSNIPTTFDPPRPAPRPARAARRVILRHHSGGFRVAHSRHNTPALHR